MIDDDVAIALEDAGIFDSAPGGRSAASRLDDLILSQRLEDWIVSTLDGKGSTAGDFDWQGGLARFNLAKRRPEPRQAATKANVATAPTWARFRVARGRGITVVSLTDRALIKEEDLIELAGDLAALVEAGHRRLVLDFSSVERLSSWAAVAIADALKSCTAAEGGAVKVAALGSEVASVFTYARLDKDVETCPDVASAINGPWPELPALRALPVPILAALLRAEVVRTPRVVGSPPMQVVRLTAQQGPDAGRSVAVRGKRFVIGRGSACQLRLNSATVSRSHAAIERRGERILVRDLASSNGTFVNGKPLRAGESELRDGDTLRIGPLAFSVAVADATPALIDASAAIERIDDLVASLARDDHREGEDDFTEDFPIGLGPVAAHREPCDVDLDLGEEIARAIRCEVVEGVIVVTPMASELDGEEAVGLLRDALTALYERDAPRRVVVSLAHVNRVCGRAIGVLLAHHLRLDRSGGGLRVALASPRVAVVLEEVRLAMLVGCYPAIDEAVLAPWPVEAVRTS